MENTVEMVQFDNMPQQKRGFWGQCAVCLRWLLIIVFSFRIAWGFYVGGSWKALVLDAALLALLTVVPRSYRKYDWSVAALGVICVTVWIFLPEPETGNWQPYVYDTEINAINAKYGVPAGENAAAYYLQLNPTEFADRTESIPEILDPRGETLSRPWTADEFPDIAAWLDSEQEKIAPFWKAVQCERCWFEIRFGDNYRLENLEYIHPICRTRDVILRQACLDLGNNNIQGAVNKYTGLLKCAAHLQQQSPLINQYLSTVIFQRTCEVACEAIVHYPINEPALDDLQEHIKSYKVEWEQIVRRFVEYRKAVDKHLFGLAFEVNDKGQTRANLNMNDLFQEERMLSAETNGKVMQSPSIFWQGRKQKFLRLREWFDKPRSPKKCFEQIDLAYERFQERLRHNELVIRSPETWLKKLILKKKPGFEELTFLKDPAKAIELMLQTQVSVFAKRQEDIFELNARKKGVLIIIALKRYYNKHGQWPDSLRDVEENLPAGILSNPELGLEFMYYRPDNSDSFVLYSYGGDDDSYLEKRNRPWVDSEKGMNDILIWSEELEDSD